MCGDYRKYTGKPLLGSPQFGIKRNKMRRLMFGATAVVTLLSLALVAPPPSSSETTDLVLPDVTTLRQSWVKRDGAARDVGVGADGSVWVIGTNVLPGGYGIWRRTGDAWTAIPGASVRIDVAPDGNAWVVNSNDMIHRYNGSTWTLMPGAAKDVGVGANGHVWVIGTNVLPGGYGIYRLTNGAWTAIPGAAVRIDVAPDGNAWVVNSYNQIYRYNGSTWTMLPGSAKDIGIGPDGRVWIAGTDDAIYEWLGDKWDEVRKGEAAQNISVGPTAQAGGAVWVVNASGQILSGSVLRPAASVKPATGSVTQPSYENPAVAAYETMTKSIEQLASQVSSQSLPSSQDPPTVDGQDAPTTTTSTSSGQQFTLESDQSIAIAPMPRVYRVKLTRMEVTEEIDDLNKNTRGFVRVELLDNATRAHYMNPQRPAERLVPVATDLWHQADWSTRFAYIKGRTASGDRDVVVTVDPVQRNGKWDFPDLAIRVYADIYERDDLINGQQRHQSFQDIPLGSIQAGRPASFDFSASASPQTFAAKGTIRFSGSVTQELGSSVTTSSTSNSMVPLDTITPIGPGLFVDPDPAGPSGELTFDTVKPVDPRTTAYNFEDGPLTLLNCSGKSVQLRTYNSDDSVLWVPFETKSLANASSAPLRCKTSTCKVKVDSAPASSAIKGNRVLYNGLIRPTNSEAMRQGCKAYY